MYFVTITIIQVASLTSLAQLLPPRSPTPVIRCRTALCAELLLPDGVRFSCCSPIASICFNCCSSFASASAAAPRLRLLQVLLAACVCFNCCSPIVPALTAAALLPDCLHPLVAPAVLAASPCPSPLFSNILRRVPRYSKLKYEGCASLV